MFSDPRYQTQLVCVLNICLYCRSLNIEELCISSAKVPPFFGTVGSTIATDLMSMLSFLLFSFLFFCFVLLTWMALVFCFPFPLLRTLNLPRQKLVGLAFAFMLGFLTIFAAICRVIAISISATVSTVTAWSALECSTGIMVACIPALNVLVLRRESSKRYPRPIGPSILSAADRNEIWDGTDATAPQWIRMASISGPGGCAAMLPTAAKFDDLVDSALSEQLTRSQKNCAGCRSDDFSMVTAVPNIRLKIGRGIVEHACMPPASPNPAHCPGNSVFLPSLMDGSGANFCSNESDDALPWVLSRCDTGESGQQIVDLSTSVVNHPGSVLLPKFGKSER